MKASRHLEVEMDGWRTRAACREWMEVFDATFTTTTTRTNDHAQRVAASVCDSCPVAGLCLAEALTTEIGSAAFGMRAGLMPDQRRRLQRSSS